MVPSPSALVVERGRLHDRCEFLHADLAWVGVGAGVRVGVGLELRADLGVLGLQLGLGSGLGLGSASATYHRPLREGEHRADGLP